MQLVNARRAAFQSSLLQAVQSVKGYFAASKLSIESCIKNNKEFDRSLLKVCLTNFVTITSADWQNDRFNLDYSVNCDYPVLLKLKP